MPGPLGKVLSGAKAQTPEVPIVEDEVGQFLNIEAEDLEAREEGLTQPSLVRTIEVSLGRDFRNRFDHVVAQRENREAVMRVIAFYDNIEQSLVATSVMLLISPDVDVDSAQFERVWEWLRDTYGFRMDGLQVEKFYYQPL